MTTFHQTPPDWLESVKDLKPGAKRRIGDGYMASFNGRAYTRFDFREKELEVYEPQLTLAERTANMRALNEATEAAAQSNQPPELMIHPRDWPVEARVWLHKAGMSNDDIAELGAGWSAGMQRTVIPLQMVDGSVGWIARAHNGPGPKYLFPTGMRRGGGAFIRGLGQPMDQRVVITEDILSSQAVAKRGNTDSVSALGTSLDRAAIVELAEHYTEVLVWLDPDYYGQLGARKIVEAFRNLGVKTRNIVSDVDPKLHTTEDIRDYLNPKG